MILIKVGFFLTGMFLIVLLYRKYSRKSVAVQTAADEMPLDLISEFYLTL